MYLCECGNKETFQIIQGTVICKECGTEADDITPEGWVKIS